MKNLFGVTPSALYASDARNESSTESRSRVLHEGGLSAAGGEVLPVPSHDPGFRVPRVVVNIVRARPIDISVIDGIVTMHGGEGQWQGASLGIVVPGLLIAGRNCVCTDSGAAAVMEYNPDAAHWTVPFQNGANTLRLAAESGIGTTDCLTSKWSEWASEPLARPSCLCCMNKGTDVGSLSGGFPV